MDHSLMGGYPESWFVSKPCNDLLCGICYDVLRDPKQCKNGHCFCFTCISHALTMNLKCPACQTWIGNIKEIGTNLVARNLVGQLILKCDLGCGWAGSLDSLPGHKAITCPFQPIKCPLKAKHNCGCQTDKILRGDLTLHLESFRKVKLFLSQINNFEKLKICGWDTVSFASGDKYKGKCLKSKRWGDGILQTSVGKYFAGEWLGEQLIGDFSVIKVDMSVYFGQVVDRMRHGRGVCVFPDGKYCGEWKDDLFCGSGWLREENSCGGSVHEGQFENGVAHGPGVHTKDDGSILIGTWVRGVLQGSVCIKGPNGLNFGGTFQNGKRNGFGVLRCKKQMVYKGSWVDDMRSGTGRGVLRDGTVCDGEWFGDEFHGVGVKTFPNGDVYSGHFVKGLRQGQGVLLYANGDNYEGQWYADKMHGFGVMKYANGDVYSGQWKESKPRGCGVINIKNGHQICGTWRKKLKHDGAVENNIDIDHFQRLHWPKEVFVPFQIRRRNHMK